MSGQVVILSGGVGGAKLVLGFARLLGPNQVSAIINTGDDFEHLGLHVSPDIDTVLYTISGKANPTQGWGRENETWSFMDAVRSLGGEDWFQLGDGDLAIHILRSARLRRGETLSAITSDMARAWGLAVEVRPMSDQRVATMLETDEGRLDFQHYFVARRCEPRVRQIVFDGASAALPAPGVVEAILGARAVIIAPSNPFLSIDPILSVPGIRQALATTKAPVVAVSPLVGGKAVKGPTAKILDELGLAADVGAIVAHYRPLLQGILVDERDQVMALDIEQARCDTLMVTLEDRVRVARAALAFAEGLSR